ncbi:MAG: tail fiber protein [Microcoleaceae cyanobacterium]
MLLGEVILYTSTVVPPGYLPADGRVLNILGNEALFRVMGNRYGGDGISTFALPNYVGGVPIGQQSFIPANNGNGFFTGSSTPSSDELTNPATQEESASDEPFDLAAFLAG